MKPTLLILAAGMGSRYGGLKQIEHMGPSGETLMDYSIYDAIRSGFGKVIFIIRQDFEQDFKAIFNNKRYNNAIQVEYTNQAIDKIPEGIVYNPDRIKPWGSGHALMMADGLIHEPFAVINSDDYYGLESFQLISDYLSNCDPEADDYCMAGFRIGNTLSELGGVSRAVCSMNDDHELISIFECHQIIRDKHEIVGSDESGNKVIIDEQAIVSMNLWGFTPGYMRHSEKLLHDFLLKYNMDLKTEFHIPFVIGSLIENNRIKVHVKETPSRWFGVTWPEDRAVVVESIKLKVCQGEYPENLWAV
jgi:hypothetical protein